VLRVGTTASADLPRECAPSGNVLFEIDQAADRASKLVTATTKLYPNGAWRTEWIDVDGKVARTAVGCLVPSSVDHIRDDLRAAKWKVTHYPIACRGYSPRFTTYSWNRRVMFTDRVCSHDTLDDDSRQVLERIDCTLDVPDDLDTPGVPRRYRGDGWRDACSGVLCK